jgi:hypothetical protein
MSIFINILLFILTACSPPIFLMTSTFVKKDNISVLIIPFKDLSGSYRNEYQIEKRISESLKEDFKGMYLNPYDHNLAPFYDKKFKNPYYPITIFTSDSLVSNDEIEKYIVKNNIDIILRGTIDIFDYSIKKTDISGAIIGIPRQNGIFDRVQGTVMVTVKFIDAKHDLCMKKKSLLGKSKLKKLEDASREEVMNNAIDSIVNDIIHIFMMRK